MQQVLFVQVLLMENLSRVRRSGLRCGESRQHGHSVKQPANIGNPTSQLPAGAVGVGRLHLPRRRGQGVWEVPAPAAGAHQPALVLGRGEPARGRRCAGRDEGGRALFPDRSGAAVGGVLPEAVPAAGAALVPGGPHGVPEHRGACVPGRYGRAVRAPEAGCV